MMKNKSYVTTELNKNKAMDIEVENIIKLR